MNFAIIDINSIEEEGVEVITSQVKEELEKGDKVIVITDDCIGTIEPSHEEDYSYTLYEPGTEVDEDGDLDCDFEMDGGSISNEDNLDAVIEYFLAEMQDQ